MSSFKNSKKALLGLVIEVLLLLSSSQFIESETPRSMNCRTFYFFNIVYIANATINDTLYLEYPINVSIEEFVTQKVSLAYYSGVNIVNGSAASFEVSPGSQFFGYVVYRVDLCYVNSSPLITEALRVNVNATVPEELAKFVEEPNPVISSVRQDFEYWLKKRSREFLSSSGQITLDQLAVLSAFFVVDYIKYDASPLPRTLREVVESRRGDCDDISRVLMNLLWSYGLPAKMIYGYLFVPNFNFTTSISNFTYVFINGGPHAFTAAYLPALRLWVSLDMLAGSYIFYPFIVDSVSLVGDVNETDVKEVEDLHRSIAGGQVFLMLESESHLSEQEAERIAIELAKTYLKFRFDAVSETAQQTQQNTSTTLVDGVSSATTSPTGILGKSSSYVMIAVVALVTILVLSALLVLRRKQLVELC